MTASRTKHIAPAAAARMGLRALGGRVSVPLRLIQTQVDSLAPSATIDLEPEHPGLRVSGSAFALGAPIRFSARIEVEGVHVRGEERLVRLTLTDVVLATDEDAPGPLADAIRNKMIDVENPGTLVGNMVALPDFVREASGSVVEIDLMRIPAISKDPLIATGVAALTSYVGVRGIVFTQNALELGLRLLPGGPKEAFLSTARAALMPAVRLLWPAGDPRR